MEVRMNNDKRYDRDNIKRIKEKYKGISLLELLDDFSILYSDFYMYQSYGSQVKPPDLDEDLEIILFKIKRYNALIKSGMRYYTKLKVQCMIDDYKKCKLL